MSSAVLTLSVIFFPLAEIAPPAIQCKLTIKEPTLHFVTFVTTSFTIGSHDNNLFKVGNISKIEGNNYEKKRRIVGYLQQPSLSLLVHYNLNNYQEMSSLSLNSRTYQSLNHILEDWDLAI
jgi:hypothetical protein